MLDIIIVRYPEDCIHKAIKGVPAEVENAICQHFKVLERPASWGMFCLSTGAELKEKCEQLSHLTEDHLQLKGLFQPLCTVKSDEKVVLLNAEGFPCYDVYCWSSVSLGDNRSPRLPRQHPQQVWAWQGRHYGQPEGLDRQCLHV